MSSLRVLRQASSLTIVEVSKEEVVEVVECRTPPLTPPWETSDPCLSFDDDSSSAVSLMEEGNSMMNSLIEEGSSVIKKRKKTTLKRKSKVQKRPRPGMGDKSDKSDKSEGTSSTDRSQEDLFNPSNEEKALPFPRLPEKNTVFLSSLPESEVIFFPPPDPTTKKKKQEKQEAGHQTISGLRGNLARDEEEQRAKGNLELKAATKVVLISYLCSPLATKKFISAFLLTFPTFMSSSDLFEGITRAVKVGDTGEKIEMIHNIFHQWMARFFKEDWNKELQDKFLAFVKTEAGEPLESTLLPPPSPRSLSSSGSLPSEASSRPSLVAHMKVCSEAAERSRTSFPLSFPKSSLPSKVKKEGGIGGVGEEEFDVNMFEEDDITQSLAMYSFAIFKEIREREFLANEKENSPHITQLISLFNHISNWVTSEIVTRAKLADRASMIEKFTNIAEKLSNLQNYLLTFAVVSGLTKSCVKRMAKTLASVSSNHLAVIDNLETNFSASNNFKSYRSILDKATPPCVPYIGVFQKDLIFMNDGNPNQIGELINFSKRSRVFEIILDSSLCQCGDYSRISYNKEFLAWVMNNAHILSEKEQFLWSRRVDPKDTEMVIAEFIEGELNYLARIQSLEEELKAEREKVENLKGKISKMVLPNEGFGSSVGGGEKKEGKKDSLVVMGSKSQRSKTLPFSHLQFRSMRMETSSVSQPSKWSVHEVVKWVEECVGEKWASAFEENQILGADLIEMEKEDLYMYVESLEICEQLYTSIRAKVNRVNVLIPSNPLTFEPLKEAQPSIDSPHLYQD